MLGRSWLKHLWSHRDLPNLKKSQWSSKAQIQSYQEKRLQKLIRYAYQQIPYYRKLFNEHHIKPEQIRSLDDLKQIPPLSRQQAIENYESLVNRSLILNTHLSSATTGQRLKWAYSKKWSTLFGQALWRGFSWAGLHPDKRVVSFFSRMIGEVAKDSLIIREEFNIERIEQELETIKQFKPHFAYCYASSAFMTAQYLLKKNLKMPLEGVIVTADQLFPHYKSVIEEAFQCKVFNNYGCNDGGAWGAECEERTSFHQDCERSIVEFEENGKMLVTDLWNDAMPFIRYENGDTGQWLNQKCPCGREMPLFTVRGRMSDYIITPTKIFSPTTIDILLRNEYFVDIQFIQHDKENLEVIYTPNPQFHSEEVHNFLHAFIQYFKELTITLNQTKRSMSPSSLKRRICINHSKQTLDSFFSKEV